MNGEEGKFKNWILYEGRAFMDLYYDRENRIKEVNHTEAHPDSLLDYFIPKDKMEALLDEAKKAMEKCKTLEDYQQFKGEWFGEC